MSLFYVWWTFGFLALTIVNLVWAMFVHTKPVLRRINLAAALSSLAMTALPAAHLVSDARAGCYPWSPHEIDFRPGMTICPGQSVRMNIEIAPKPPDREI